MPSEAQQSAAAPPDLSSVAREEQMTIAEMTRLMDVAAAIRKERLTAEQQLNIDETKQLLRERLLETARITGDPVTEQEIDAAIDAYYERRHEFTPPEPGMETLLASLYVRRGTITKLAITVATITALWWSVFAFGLVGPKRQERRLAELYTGVQTNAAVVDELAQTPDLRQRVEQLVAQADAARAAGDADALQNVQAELMEQAATLKQQYVIRVVAGENERSGTERLFTDADGTRTSGFYLIVQAETPAGEALKLPIRDAESGEIRLVSRWGEQVPESVFEQIAADKQTDGVVDNRDFAEKEVGRLEPTVRLTGPDGAPLTRGRQITTW
ncbi:hypothetical protein Pla123a_17890 [Posidoniimonas polymericola]|uniref:Uncharacterized protein n=1 Tax=Posidoniimonas polymericola TaxID=2528002 RepID=A0A5C5YT88_9BACT|nr:DUF6384 family protein [Posidoniimonas polymericola]TWT77990.1 hypothetical protein Pla123a_17890 [Posidoniimonas polymericola]